MNPIRILKLFFISVIVFGILLFCLSLLFPSTTYVSRAVNVKGEREKVFPLLHELNMLAFRQNSLFSINKLEMLESTIRRRRNADTVFTDVNYSNIIQEGLAFYPAGNDSTTIQVYYKIHVPFYKPWKKFGLMLNETRYGPSLDSAISRISEKF